MLKKRSAPTREVKRSPKTKADTSTKSQGPKSRLWCVAEIRGKSKRMGRFVVVGPNRPVSEVLAPYVPDFIIGNLDRWFRIFYNALWQFTGY